jgi:hypothetical protein
MIVKLTKRVKKKKKGKVYIDGLGDELIELGNIKEEDNDFIIEYFKVQY